MSTVMIIELAASVILFALCLAGFLHTRNYIKVEKLQLDETPKGVKLFKRKKRNKKLFFVGMIMGLWYFIGVMVTEIADKKAGLKLEFSMFSDRVNFFGTTIAETTITASCIVLFIALLCLLFRIFAFPKFKDEPKGLQNVVELCVESMDNFTKSAVGKRSSGFLAPYMFAMALFLVGSAAVELFGLRAPTSDLTVTFSMGLLTFLFLNYYGFRRLGFAGRFKAMGGPVVPMRVIMIPLKMVSDIAVPVSLACRLFGNMLGGMIVMDLIKGALGGYSAGIPAVAGLYFNLFHPLIQAYIFITLSLTFIEEAMEPVQEDPNKKKKAKKSKNHDEISKDAEQNAASSAASVSEAVAQ